MLNSIKQDLAMLKNSKRNIVLFEITYKLAATAVVYPMAIFLLNFAMKITGIRYFTNEYIASVVTNPIVIVGIILVLILTALYVFYEMCFLNICFEAKRRKSEVSVLENFYTAIDCVRKRINRRNICVFLFLLLSVICVNVAVFCNMLYSHTMVNLLQTGIAYSTWYIKAGVILLVIVIFTIVIRGVYSFNIFFLEKRSFKESYKRSTEMVRNNLFGTIVALVLYNICVLLFIGILYVIISAILIAGVKLLDMAYIGSTIYLSALKYVRTGTKIFMAYMAVPVSFCVITRRYYKYADLEKIDFTVIYIKEKNHRIKKMIYYMLLVISIVLNSAYIVVAFNKNPFDKIAVFHETSVTAHRGGALLAPENTLAAFSKAIEDKADYIELDVRQTKDKQIVVMHDANAYRTTGVDRNISDMTLKEVKELDAGSHYSDEYRGEQVPTLAEVLELTKDSIKLNIEIKTADTDYNIAEQVVDIIEQYHAEEECVITSFDYNILKSVKSLNEDIKVGYILSVAYGDFYDSSEVDFFSMNASFLSKRLVDAIHKSGKQVYAWTVNNESSIRNLTNKGVDNIITDQPVLAKKTILSRDTSETLVNMTKYVFNQ